MREVNENFFYDWHPTIGMMGMSLKTGLTTNKVVRLVAKLDFKSEHLSYEVTVDGDKKYTQSFVYLSDAIGYFNKETKI